MLWAGEQSTEKALFVRRGALSSFFAERLDSQARRPEHWKREKHERYPEENCDVGVYSEYVLERFVVYAVGVYVKRTQAPNHSNKCAEWEYKAEGTHPAWYTYKQGYRTNKSYKLNAYHSRFRIHRIIADEKAVYSAV